MTGVATLAKLLLRDAAAGAACSSPAETPHLMA
jgi:hypothetical protein